MFSLYLQKKNTARMWGALLLYSLLVMQVRFEKNNKELLSVTHMCSFKCQKADILIYLNKSEHIIYENSYIYPLFKMI